MNQSIERSAVLSRWFLTLVRLAVGEMNVPIRRVLGSQGRVVNN